MKINTTRVLTNLEGKPLQNEGKDITLGSFLGSTLAYTNTENQYKSWLLAMKFSKQEEVHLDSEDIVYIKKILDESKTIFPIAGGQVINILEGKDETDVIKEKQPKKAKQSESDAKE